MSDNKNIQLVKIKKLLEHLNMILRKSTIALIFLCSNLGASYGAGDVSGGTRRSRLERMDRDRGDRMDHDYGEEEHGVDYGSASRRRQQQDSRALNAI